MKRQNPLSDPPEMPLTTTRLFGGVASHDVLTNGENKFPTPNSRRYLDSSIFRRLQQELTCVHAPPWAEPLCL